MKAARRWVAPLVLSVCLGWAPLGNALPVLSVEGTPNGFDTFFGGSVFGLAFEFDQTIQDVAISAAVDCINCSGQVYLTNHLSDPTRLGVIDAFVFSDLTTNLTPTGLASQSLFSGLNLVADLYFLIFQLNPGSSPVGWYTADPSTEVGQFGAMHAFDFQALLPEPFAPHSQGIQLLNAGGGFLFDITGMPLPDNPTQVPEPSTALLMLGLGALLLVRRRMMV